MTALRRLRAPLAAASDWGLPARLTLLLLGLALYGLALRLTLDAQVGVAPWDVLHTGLAARFQLTVGQAGILLGTVLVAFNRLFLGQPIGVGTALNAILVGAFVDLFSGLPHPETLPLRWTELIGGTALLGLATGTYVAAGLGAGPRDGLVLGLARRSGQPVAAVRAATELSVLTLGWALGGSLGLGTAAFALLSGPAMSWGLSVYGLTPKRNDGEG